MKQPLPYCALFALVSVLSATAQSFTPNPQPVFTNASDFIPIQGAAGDSVNPTVTPDGRYIAYSSTAANLVTTSNGLPFLSYSTPKLNAYRYDRVTKRTELASIALSGDRGANSDVLARGISDDGRFVLFESSADNLVLNDRNFASDVFVRDMLTGTTLSATAKTNVATAHGWQSVMSRDGYKVAFVSRSREYSTADTNNVADVFVQDMKSGSTLMVAPQTPSQGALAPLMTPDGRYVACLSIAATYGNSDEIFMLDTQSGVTMPASLPVHQVLAGPTTAYSHAISDDGRFIAFLASTNMSAVAGIIARHNLSTGEFEVLSTNAVCARSSYPGHSSVRALDMSRDGRYVAFLERAAGGGSRVRLWDGQTRVTTSISLDDQQLELTNVVCEWPAISPGGRYVSFLCDGANVVARSSRSGFRLYVRDTLNNTTWCADPPGDESAAVQFISPPSWGADGAFLVFDAVSGGNGLNSDVFIADAAAKSVELISTRAPELQSVTQAEIQPRSQFALSTDARYITFVTPGQKSDRDASNRAFEVYSYDRHLRTNRLVSAASNGLDAAEASAWDPKASADGRIVAFTTYATNLTPLRDKRMQYVFSINLDSGSRQLVSVEPNGTLTNTPSFVADISADGTRVLWSRRNPDRLYWRDIPTAQTRLITNSFYCAAMSRNGQFVAIGGKPAGMVIQNVVEGKVVQFSPTRDLYEVAISPDGKRAAGAGYISLYLMDSGAMTSKEIATLSYECKASLGFSANGRYLVFSTPLPQILSDTNKLRDVYVYDCESDTTQLISKRPATGQAGNGLSDNPVISPDGRFIAFRSLATDIGATVVPSGPNLWFHDRLTGTNILLTPRTGLVLNPNEPSSMPVFSMDGTTLAFRSWASDLVPNDYNFEEDLFILKLPGAALVPLLKGEIAIAAGGAPRPVLAWQTQPGKTYRVQFKDRLDDLSWQNLEVTIETRNNRATALDPAPPISHRFYRIVTVD